ncbi:MAG: hypothetical protein U9P14_10835, partial [Gemmatimonadota bacterium]|nr:hypothetical protein [Gemmatimonadota bacterium]
GPRRHGNRFRLGLRLGLGFRLGNRGRLGRGRSLDNRLLRSRGRGWFLAAAGCDHEQQRKAE